MKRGRGAPRGNTHAVGVKPDKKLVEAVNKAVAGYTSIHAASVALKMNRQTLLAIMAGSPVQAGSISRMKEQLRFAKHAPVDP
jgi:hypothetical protein